MRTNEFEQPIGEDLGNWTPPAKAPALTPLIGQYVTLEPVERTRHAIPLFHTFKTCDPKMWTYMAQGPFQDAAELGQILRGFERSPDVNGYAVVVNNEPVGFLTQMRIRPEVGVLEIGWVTFATSMQRTRASTEAQYLLLKHGFDAGYRRIEWKCDSLNAVSRAAAERLGYKFEGVFEKLTHYKGRNRDTAWYAITDDNWPGVMSRLETWLNPANFDEAGNQVVKLTR